MWGMFNSHLFSEVFLKLVAWKTLWLIQTNYFSIHWTMYSTQMHFESKTVLYRTWSTARNETIILLSWVLQSGSFWDGEFGTMTETTKSKLQNSLEIYHGLDMFTSMWKELYLNTLHQDLANLPRPGELKKQQHSYGKLGVIWKILSGLGKRNILHTFLKFHNYKRD